MIADRLRSAAHAVSATFGVSRSAYSSISEQEALRLLYSSGIYGGAIQTRAGVPMGPGESIQVSAHIACIQRIATTMAAIPCNLKKRRRKGYGSGSDIAHSHPTNWVVDGAANSEMTSFSWQLSRVINRAIYGTSYDVKDYDALGRVIALWPSISANVQPTRIESINDLTEIDDVSRPGDLAYRITKTWPEHVQGTWPKSRILPIPGMTTFNGIVGIPSYKLMRQKLAVADALQKWETDFFGKGYSPAYIAKGQFKNYPQKTAEETVEYLRQQYQGFKSNHQLIIPPGDMEIAQDVHRLDYAMLSERNREHFEDVCGYWGVPPILCGKSWGATYTNSVEFFLQYLKLAIFPWGKNDTQSFNMWLLNDAQRRNGFFFEYDYSILEKMDGKNWSDMIRTMWQAGSVKPDEIRADKNMNPLEDEVGQKTYIQQQMIELGSENPTQTNVQPGKLEVVKNTETGT